MSEEARECRINIAFLRNVAHERKPVPRCCMSPFRLVDYLRRMMQDSRQFTHAELYFDAKDFPQEYRRLVEPAGRTQRQQYKPSDFVVAVGAVEEKGVFAMERVFTNMAYETLSLRVTRTQFNACLKYAFGQVERRTPYNFSMAGWRIFWAPQTYRRGDPHWCASFVHACLRQAGFLRLQRINTLDVPYIYALISGSAYRCGLGSSRPLVFRQGLQVVLQGGREYQVAQRFESLLAKAAVAHVEEGSSYLMPAAVGGSGSASSAPIAHHGE